MPTAPSSLAIAETAILHLVNGTISNKAAALITWTNNAPSTAEHHVEWSGDSGSTWKPGGVANVGDASLLVTGIPLTAANLTFRAYAVDNTGTSTVATTSQIATPVLATVGNGPTAPGSLAVVGSPTNRTVTLSWEDQSANEAYFEVEVTCGDRGVRSVYIPGTVETATIDVQDWFGRLYPPGYSVALQLFSARVRAIGGKGTTSNYPKIFGAWSSSVTFKMGAPTIYVTSATSVIAEVGAAFSYKILTNTPATSWLAGSDFPAGLDIADDTISGTPTEAGVTIVEINVGDGATSATLLLRFDIRISSLYFQSARTATAFIGVAFTYTIVARVLNSVGQPTITFGADNLPNWLSLAGNTLTGTPVEAGVHEIVITGNTASAASSITLVVTVPALVINGNASLFTVVGQPLLEQLTSTPAGAVFSLTDDAPAWLNIDEKGRLVGTPPEEDLNEDIPVDVIATIGTTSVSKTMTITVADPFTIDDVIVGRVGELIAKEIRFNGAADTDPDHPGSTEIILWDGSNLPQGVALTNEDGSGSNLFIIARKILLLGKPTEEGEFYCLVTVRAGRVGTHGDYDAPILAENHYDVFQRHFTLRITGGLYFAWFHDLPERYDLQVFLQDRTVASYRFQGDEGLWLKQGEHRILYVIFRDGTTAKPGHAIVADDITTVRLILRPPNNLDAEPYLEIGGDVVIETIDGNTVFKLEFDVESEAIEAAFSVLNEAPGAEPFAVSLAAVAEIEWTLDTLHRSRTFPAAIAQAVTL
jgi:hypothetical protein